MSAQPHEDPDQLADLQKEERTVSARRTRLDNRIDFLRAGRGGADDLRVIEELEREEHELSLRRRELHERIERLSAQLAADRR